MEIYASLPAELGLDEIAVATRRAEALGFDGVQVSETVHDVTLSALVAIQSSSRLLVRTSVAVAFPRSPMVLALAAWDLQRASGGRFRLGLGTQVKGNIEGRYSVPWVAPVARLEEYVRALRAIWSSFQTGQPLHYVGEHYSFTKLQPYFNPGPIEHPDIPIYVGGVNPGMCRMAGRVADGLITHPTSSVPQVISRISDDVKAAHRELPDPADIVVNAQFVSDPTAADVEAQLPEKRRLFAFLYSTPAYAEALNRLGEADRAEQLHQHSRAGEWDAMTTLMDESLLRRLVPVTPYADLAAALLDRFGAFTQSLVLPLPASDASDASFAKVLAALR